MSDEEIKLPAFGLAEDMIAQLEEMLAKKKQAADEPQALADVNPLTQGNGRKSFSSSRSGWSVMSSPWGSSMSVRSFA
jgi:hypothetical protein